MRLQAPYAASGPGIAYGARRLIAELHRHIAAVWLGNSGNAHEGTARAREKKKTLHVRDEKKGNDRHCTCTKTNHAEVS
eukprot:3183703-Rhodomonas_salina.2